MARKAFKFILYATVGGGGGIAAMYLGGAEWKHLGLALPVFAFVEDKRTFTHTAYAGQPSKWIYDWDNRDTTDARKETKVVTSKHEIKSKEKINNNKPVATRHLILVRHGQYNLKGERDEDRYLTSLGQQQADSTGSRLKELGLPYTILVHSTMTRATETAKIIHKHLKEIPMESCDLLREGAPFPPEPPIHHWKQTQEDFYEDGARIESAFHKYFHRADPSQLQDSYEVIVCHANVIRYFLCRCLQLPPEAWLRFTLHNCSLTWIKIRPNGRVGAYIVGDCGHMPPHLMTTS